MGKLDNFKLYRVSKKLLSINNISSEIICTTNYNKADSSESEDK